jgi:hypothetical protein
MGKIVMTLLVRRVPEEDSKCPYAVQMALPKELTPGELVSLTSVRLINKSGGKASVLETTESYDPHEWRAATLSEQADFAATFNGNPEPWFCVMRSLTKNVFDFAGAGDRQTNNGQIWGETGESGKVWTSERLLKGKCQEELDADWSKHISEAFREQALRQEHGGSRVLR